MEFNSFNQSKGLTWYNHYENILNWHNKRGKLMLPVGVTIDLTTSCNLHCKGCNAMRSWDKGINMPTSEALEIIDYLYKWKKESKQDDVLLSICFAGGGEPTIHPGFSTIIKYASDKGFEVGMSTNGTMLIKKEVREAIVKYADFCGISMDAGNSKVWNDYKQMSTGYDNLIEGIKSTLTLIKRVGGRKYKKHGKLDLVYKFLITPDNQSNILEGAMNAKNLGFDSFFVRPAAMEGIESFGMEDKVLNRDLIFNQIEKAKEVTMANGDFIVHSSFGRVNPKTLGRIQKFKKCYATPLLIQICADGYMYMCIDSRYIQTRKIVKWNELKDYWGSASHKKIVNKIDCKLCPRCFVSGTKILTSDGIKNIEDVKEGEYVMSSKGEFNKVTHIFKNKYNGTGTSLKIYGNDKEITCTSEHPIYALTTKKCCYGFTNNTCKPNCNYLKYRIRQGCKNGCEKYYESYEPEFIPAYKLTKNDFVLIPKTQSSVVMDHWLSNDKFLRLLGYYLSEGYCPKVKRGGEVRFAFNKNELSYINEVKEIIAELFTLKTKENTRDNTTELTIYSKYLSEIFSPFGKRAIEKRLTSTCFYLNIGQKRTLLETYINGDGCRNKYDKGESISISTASETLAHQIRLLIYSLGVSCRISSRVREGKIKGRILKKGTIYDVRINNVKMFNQEPHQNRVIELEQFMAVPIHNITTKTLDCYVYNLEVENDPTYLADGIIVHNCAFGIYNEQIEKAVINDDLWVSFP